MTDPEEDKIMGKRHEDEQGNGKRLFSEAKKLGFDKQDIKRLKRLYAEKLEDDSKRN